MSVHTDEVVSDQGTASPLSGGWPVKVTDGTNVLGTSGNPVRTDPTGTTVQPVSGTVTTSPVVSSTSAVTGVAIVASTNTVLLAANANRKKAILSIPKGTTYVKFGVTASATSYTYVITTNQATIEVLIWTGEIDVFSTQAQTILVTELT